MRVAMSKGFCTSSTPSVELRPVPCRLPPALHLQQASVRCKAAQAEALQTVQAPGLYLLHWHSSKAEPVPTAQGCEKASAEGEVFVEKLRADLKMMEKVAKEAVWFTAVDADDGQHVLMVTDEKKLAKKYNLPGVEGESYPVELPGKSITIPLAGILQQLAAEKDSSDSSDSDEEMMAEVKAGELEVAVSGMQEEKEDHNNKLKKMEKKLKKEAKRNDKLSDSNETQGNMMALEEEPSSSDSDEDC